MDESHEELRNLITRGSEARNRELKRSMDWNSAETKRKLTKSILAMSNLRDGGFIIIGVSEHNRGEFSADGMTDEDKRSFSADDMDDYVHNFADPYVEFDLREISLDDKAFLVIRVSEFDESPVICGRDAEGLRKGAIYTRSRRKPETVEVPDHIEMREIVDLAVEKRLRKEVELIRSLGLLPEMKQSFEEKSFDDQLGDL